MNIHTILGFILGASPASGGDGPRETLGEHLGGDRCQGGVGGRGSKLCKLMLIDSCYFLAIENMDGKSCP